VIAITQMLIDDRAPSACAEYFSAMIDTIDLASSP
jgi:hypothetical protein